MKKGSTILTLYVGAGLLLACTANPAPTPAATPTEFREPTIVTPSGYRPLQSGDTVEGARIGYQYFLPSIEQPAVVIDFGQNLLEFFLIKPELSAQFVEYIRDIVKTQKPILAYDESNPSQTEPKEVGWDGTKPVEIAYVPLEEGAHYWSVTETNEDGVQAAYKIVRRKDGGLRFIDAYGSTAQHTATGMITLNGGGMGLVFSARLALLKMILSDPKFQRGSNVFATYPVDYKAYDPRILVLDPTRAGPTQNRDWVLVSRPGPDPGRQGP
jgi:hypothetical protein